MSWCRDGPNAQGCIRFHVDLTGVFVAARLTARSVRPGRQPLPVQKGAAAFFRCGDGRPGFVCEHEFPESIGGVLIVDVPLCSYGPGASVGSKGGEVLQKIFTVAAAAVVAAVMVTAMAGASTPGGDVRLTQDCVPDLGCAGYVSDYTLVTGQPYSDKTLAECSVSHGRQNEPSVAVDPRNTAVVLVSSNDYCGVYNSPTATGPGPAVGPIWLGYYRSENSGSSFVSSLVPGYPEDSSPYAALSQARTATAGDPVIAWDNHGRAFFGSESSGDPAGTGKTFGDVFVARYINSGGGMANDGKKYDGTTVVSQGSSAPNLQGVFNDKTAINVDRTGGTYDGNVYFAYSRFNGNGSNAIYFARSTDHGVTFSQPVKISEPVHSVQDPEISITGDGHVFVTFRQFDGPGQSGSFVDITQSTDGGQTFGPVQQVQQFVASDAADQPAPTAIPQPTSQLDDPASGDVAPENTGARDCGDFSGACKSGFTFFRRTSTPRSSADQQDKTHDYVYIVYDATIPTTIVPSTTTYQTVDNNQVGQSAVYYLRYDGSTGSKTAPQIVAPSATGHQVFPAVSADAGSVHLEWWDSRNDPCYSVQLPIANCWDGTTAGLKTTDAGLDVYATSSTNAVTVGPTQPATFDAASKLTDQPSNPNYEQFGNRTVPFAGDYLWVSSIGSFTYSVWTDWRNAVQGPDQREITEDADGMTADVHQCRNVIPTTVGNGKNQQTINTFSSDQCPHAGGIDQNIYGDLSP